VLLAVALVVAAIRVLRSPRVRATVTTAAGAAAALAVADGYGVVVLAAAVVMAAGTFGCVGFLHRIVVPAPARTAA
jgi:hypothetical protein